MNLSKRIVFGSMVMLCAVMCIIAVGSVASAFRSCRQWNDMEVRAVSIVKEIDQLGAEIEQTAREVDALIAQETQYKLAFSEQRDLQTPSTGMVADQAVITQNSGERVEANAKVGREPAAGAAPIVRHIVKELVKSTPVGDGTLWGNGRGIPEPVEPGVCEEPVAPPCDPAPPPVCDPAPAPICNPAPTTTVAPAPAPKPAEAPRPKSVDPRGGRESRGDKSGGDKSGGDKGGFVRDPHGGGRLN